MTNRPRRTHRIAASILIGAALALAGCGNGGALRIEPERFDFGSVRHGEVRLATLRLVNDGAKDVTFQVSPNCECIGVGGGYRNVIAPGESVDLAVRFDSGRISPGEIDGKFFLVRTDEEGGRQVRVAVRGVVRKVVEATGTKIQLGEIGAPRPDAITALAEFRPADGFRLAVERIDPLGPDSAHLEASPRGPDDGGAVRVEIAVRPDARRRIGPLHAEFVVHLRATDADGTASTVRERVVVDGFWGANAPR